MELTLAYLDESNAKSVLFTTAIGLLFFYSLFYLQNISRPIKGFPLVGKQDGEWTLMQAQKRFSQNSKLLLTDGLKRFKGRIFQVVNHAGPALILPPKYIHEIRNHTHLNMDGIARQDFFTDYPAFKGMNAGQIDHVLSRMVSRKLTTSLALITEPVNEESEIAIPQHWPEVKEWTPTPLVEKVMLLTSQVTSRIFLGAPLCRDPIWIGIARDYTMELMIAAFTMRAMPSWIRPVAYYFLPPIKKLQNTVNEATRIIKPEIDARRKAKAEALARGATIPKHLDSIDWLDDLAPPGFDLVSCDVGAQLSLTFVAVHTTSMSTAHIMYDLIEQPELVKELREEIVSALLEDGGFQKTTLYKMRLLDSVMKESQRVHVLADLIMQRQSSDKVTLEDGTVIPKGSRVFVSALHMQDAEYYPDPQKFDGKRWLRQRDEPGNQNRFQYVTTTPEHIGFGHGEHSCPGRFFASNEIKIMVVHLLLKYDWAFKEGKRPQSTMAGSESTLDAKTEILYRSRKPEIDLANIPVAV